MRKMLPWMVSWVALACSASAAAGVLDRAFGASGFVVLEAPPSAGYGLEARGGLAIQTDGRIVLGGRVGMLAAVGRLLADGSWDQGFGDHGVFVLPQESAAAPAGGEIHNVIVLSDHGIVAAGGAWNSFPDFETCTLLLKLDSTGAPDADFGPEHSGASCFDFAPNAANVTVPRHNEGFIAGADDTLYLTTPYTNLATGAVAHLDGAGAPIAAYGNGGIAALPGGAVATRLQITGSNEVVAMGGVANPYAIAVVRLDTSGNPDAAFGDGGLRTFDPQPGGLVSPSSALLDAQQRLLIADNDESGGDLLAYRFARVTASGALDASFNGNAQQPGFAGLAALVLGASDFFDGLEAALPLADGHILGIGDAGPVGDGDGLYDLALLRLADDGRFDAGFGDAAHPGWALINIGGGPSGTTRVRATAMDAAGHAFVVVDAYDGQVGCTGILRLIPDRLFDADHEPAAPSPHCPP